MSLDSLYFPETTLLAIEDGKENDPELAVVGREGVCVLVATLGRPQGPAFGGGYNARRIGPENPLGLPSIRFIAESQLDLRFIALR